MKYFSEILNKNFDTEKELHEAEKEHEAAEAKKAEAKALVKKESDEVNKAFVAKNEARKAYNTTALEAAKVFNQKLKELEEEYSNSIEEARKAAVEAENPPRWTLKHQRSPHGMPTEFHLPPASTAKNRLPATP